MINMNEEVKGDSNEVEKIQPPNKKKEKRRTSKNLIMKIPTNQRFKEPCYSKKIKRNQRVLIQLSLRRRKWQGKEKTKRSNYLNLPVP